VDEKEVPEEFKIVFYRVMQEALTNAARHSQADTVSLRLAKDDSGFELEVMDNGCGFVPGEAFDGRDGLSGFGLKNMQERAEICGGCLTLRTHPGKGTSVKISLPLSPAPPVGLTLTAPTAP
jgi:signal transduction histidine kinase